MVFYGSEIFAELAYNIGFPLDQVNIQFLLCFDPQKPKMFNSSKYFHSSLFCGFEKKNLGMWL
jgi:hypothetical protein